VLDKQVEQMLALIDLTSLNETDTPSSISLLCQKATTPKGVVAAVCISPAFVKQAAVLLNESPIKIATVANFPHGTNSLNQVLYSIEQSIKDGAHEVDVVFPYSQYLAGEALNIPNFVQSCKSVCGEQALLKVILETGAFSDMEMISDLSREIIKNGADFLKTSTGKISTGATLAAATAMLLAIKEMTPVVNRVVGFKAAGGIRRIEEAVQYVTLAKQIMGAEWVTSRTFRFGASQLLDALVIHH
jgi:deoxyribose-phosphate aldolase